MPLKNITVGTGGMAPDPKKKSNLLIRIISAAVMLPIAIYIILSGGLPYFILVTILTLLILSEWNGIVENRPFSFLVFVQMVCATLLLLSVNVGSVYLNLSVICCAVAIIAAAYFSGAKLVWALTGFLYALAPSVAFILIHQEQGGEVVLWMMIVIWAMDTGAYFAGKNIGGPKMAPKISPNKTWAGLIGGTLASMLFASLYVHYIATSPATIFIDATILLILSGLLGILSQVGDLAESAVKRSFSKKDSGSIIPGHGGVMDRVDGVLFVAPAVLTLPYVLYA